MGRKSQTVQSAQNELESRRAEDAMERKTTLDSDQEASAVTQEVIGPEEPEELLGCQEDEMDAAGSALPLCAVTAAGGLRLRQEPNLQAPVIAELPCGAGVYAEGEAVNGWLHVRTGRLEGFMMARYLEVLPLPELCHASE